MNYFIAFILGLICFSHCFVLYKYLRHQRDFVETMEQVKKNLELRDEQVY